MRTWNVDEFVANFIWGYISLRFHSGALHQEEIRDDLSCITWLLLVLMSVLLLAAYIYSSTFVFIDHTDVLFIINHTVISVAISSGDEIGFWIIERKKRKKERKKKEEGNYVVIDDVFAEAHLVKRSWASRRCPFLDAVRIFTFQEHGVVAQVVRVRLTVASQRTFRRSRSLTHHHRRQRNDLVATPVRLWYCFREHRWGRSATVRHITVQIEYPQNYHRCVADWFN